MVLEEGQCRHLDSLLLLEPDISNPEEDDGVAVSAMSCLFLMLLTKVY